MRRKVLLCLALAAALGACEAATGSGEREATVENPGQEGLVEESGREPPPGAIRTGDDLYMVAIGRDSSGCLQFKPWSKSRMVPAAIYFRKADGDFTLYKDEADCSAG